MGQSIHPHNLGRLYFKPGEAWYTPGKLNTEPLPVVNYQITQTLKHRYVVIMYGDDRIVRAIKYIDPEINYYADNPAEAVIEDVEKWGYLSVKRVLIHKCDDDRVGFCS